MVNTSDMTREQLEFLLSKSMEENKVDEKDLNRYQSQMQSYGQALLGTITETKTRTTKSNGSATKTSKRTSTRKERKTAHAKDVEASRKLQGQYISRIRQIPDAQRGRISKIAKDQGRQAALDEMDKILAKV